MCLVSLQDRECVKLAASLIDIHIHIHWICLNAKSPQRSRLTKTSGAFVKFAAIVQDHVKNGVRSPRAIECRSSYGNCLHCHLCVVVVLAAGPAEPNNRGIERGATVKSDKRH